MEPRLVRALSDKNHPDHVRALNQLQVLRQVQTLLAGVSEEDLQERPTDAKGVFDAAIAAVTADPDKEIVISMPELGGLGHYEVRGVAMPQAFWNRMDQLANEHNANCPNPDCGGHSPNSVVGESLRQFWISPDPAEMAVLSTAMISLGFYAAAERAHGMPIMDMGELGEIFASIRAVTEGAPISVIRESLCQALVGILVANGGLTIVPDLVAQVGVSSSMSPDDLRERITRAMNDNAGVSEEFKRMMGGLFEEDDEDGPDDEDEGE